MKLIQYIGTLRRNKPNDNKVIISKIKNTHQCLFYRHR